MYKQCWSEAFVCVDPEVQFTFLSVETKDSKSQILRQLYLIHNAVEWLLVFTTWVLGKDKNVILRDKMKSNLKRFI